MKLLINGDRIAGTATDDYIGPMQYMDAPVDFDINQSDRYILLGGNLVIPAPQSVTMRQARLALLQDGLLDTVNSAVAVMPGASGDAARVEWEYASTVERNSPLVQAMAGVLAMDAAGLDALFISAGSL